jgi:hypothetical protein
MADYCINVFLDDEQQKKLQEVGLGDHISEIDGKKAVQVAMSEKDQKKLKKGFPGLEFNESNACVLPDDAQITLMDIIMNMKSLDVMTSPCSTIPLLESNSGPRFTRGRRFSELLGNSGRNRKYPLSAHRR